MPVVLCVLLLLLSPLLSAAEWQLEPDYSRISFVSVKRAKMAEVQRFDRLSGQIDKQGVARIVVPLGTLDSGLALRDERMKDNFFETSRFPEATVESRLDMAGFDDLRVGQSRVEKLDFTLDLLGQQRRLKADVLVTRQGEGLVQVATLEPVLLKLLDFDLEEKLKPLKEMANIPSITPEVPVFAVLNFREVPPEQF
ncbi:YceI family protein [Pseudomonas aeruginosa]|uniref:YceI family protein n=1 Tax=Pseudomonas aeruginosa TaxID=287 RepID=UPI0008776AF8|nr:YceI family protein [Pseudomonas aeruginosa]